MALKRVFAGFYTRYDGKPIFVVRVLKDIDTGESIVVCKDASFSKEDNEHYYLIRYTSFCEQVEVDGVLRDKYVRQTRRDRAAAGRTLSGVRPALAAAGRGRWCLSADAEN